MRNLVFQHLSVERPGIFRDFWTKSGDSWHAVELDEGDRIPPLEDFDLLVVMGGPMDVWQEDLHPWLFAEKAAIRRWVKDLGRPYLGICLGHQLLAEALGGKVRLMAAPEVGLSSVQLTEDGQADPLFRGFEKELETFQWHGAEIAHLPEGAKVLAANAACPTQAIRWGEHAYGLQYHVEITASTVSDWEAVPEYKSSLERALGKEEAARLNEVVAPRLDTFGSAARRLYDNFSAILTRSAKQYRDRGLPKRSNELR